MQETAAFPISFFPRLAVNGKAEIISRLVRGVKVAAPLEVDEIIIEVMKRESGSSTVIADGVYVPHARIEGLENLTVAVATLAHPLPDTAVPDEMAIEIVCLLLIPAAEPMAALKVMSRFALSMRDPVMRATLLAAKNIAEASPFFSLLGHNEHPTLTAADIMAPCTQFLTREMSLKEATRQMTVWRRDIVPVLDGKRLIGEIACDALFKLGIPEFFTQLKSVGFIRHFDPFANYFHMEAGATVGDVMRETPETIPSEATLIEIVFLVTVKKVPLVYVVDADKEMLGIIDQSLLLERIINI